MEQFAPAATDEPQLLVWAKSPAAVIEVIASAELPEFVRVTFCAVLTVPTCWLPKVTLLAERLTSGAKPVPLSETLCGLFAALSVMEIIPVRVPETVGVKVTEIVQVEFDANDDGQLFV
jgi:hypothetical protein